jgi:hypothetical protein
MFDADHIGRAELDEAKGAKAVGKACDLLSVVQVCGFVGPSIAIAVAAGNHTFDGSQGGPPFVTLALNRTEGAG